MIRILIDSSADYTAEEIRERGFVLVPLNIIMGDHCLRDGVDLTRNELYEYMLSTGDVPKTSQPSPQDFVKEFERAKENNEQLICILISSALSGTVQSAMIAKTMVDYDGIFLIDALTTTHAIRIMAEYGRKLINQGLAAKEIVHRIDAMKSRIRIAAALDTLEYLCKGGRIGKAAASIGELAGIKPIITVNQDGTVGILGKSLGRAKATANIIKYIKEHPRDPEFPLYSLYSHEIENCLRLEEKLASIGVVPEERLEIGATIGVHVGPGAFAVIYVEK